MKWEEIDQLPCSIARTLSVIGDRWTALIVREAFMGVRRFEALQKGLGITRHRLSDRLERLIEEGVMERRPYQDNPPRFEYRLTEKGRDLYPIILMMRKWGDTWMAGEAGPPTLLRHNTCGHIVQPKLVCSECNEPISPFDITPLPGPGIAGHAIPAAYRKPDTPVSPAPKKRASKTKAES